jgi:hypothetical protein
VGPCESRAGLAGSVRGVGARVWRRVHGVADGRHSPGGGPGVLSDVVAIDVHQLLVEEGALELHGGGAHHLEDGVRVGLADLNAELLELAVDGARAGVLADHYLALQTDVFRREGLVVQRILDNPVGVDAALVGEDVSTHDALPGGDRARRVLTFVDHYNLTATPFAWA